MKPSIIKATLVATFGLLSAIWCSICPRYTLSSSGYWTSAPAVNPDVYYQIDFGKFMAGEIFIGSILTALFIVWNISWPRAGGPDQGRPKE